MLKQVMSDVQAHNSMSHCSLNVHRGTGIMSIGFRSILRSDEVGKGEMIARSCVMSETSSVISETSSLLSESPIMRTSDCRFATLSID